VAASNEKHMNKRMAAAQIAAHQSINVANGGISGSMA